MNFQPVFDISWGVALYFLGMMVFPFVVVWTLLSEAVALYLLRFHRSFWRCLGNATVANLVSGAVGLAWQIFFFDITSYFYWVNSLIGSPPIDTYQTLDARTQFLGIGLLLLVGWIGSILLEGLVLMILRILQWDSASEREPGAQRLIWYALKVSAIINTISYSGLIVAMILL